MRILIMGYYGFGNQGDEAILAATLKQLKERFPRFIPVLLYPRGKEPPPNVEVIIRDELWSLLKGIKRCQALLGGGGSLFQDVTSKKSLLYYLGVMLLALLMRRKVFLLGQGMGPIHSGWGRFLLPRILNYSSFVGLRDELSLNLLRQLGVQEKKLHLGADLALILDPVERGQARQLLQGEGFPLQKKGFALSFRPGSLEHYYPILLPFIQAFAREKNLIPVFFPLFPGEDLSLSERLMGSVNTGILIRGTYTPQEVMGMMGEMDLVLGVRLHALIFAARSGIPLVGIPYDPKVRGFLRLCGLEEATILPGDDGEQFYQVLSSIYQDWEEKKGFVEKRVKALQSRVYQIWELLEEEMG